MYKSYNHVTNLEGEVVVSDGAPLTLVVKQDGLEASIQELKVAMKNLEKSATEGSNEMKGESREDTQQLYVVKYPLHC